MVAGVQPQELFRDRVPDVRPDLQPTRPVFINTPEAAFGGARAQALGLLGRAEEGAGNELATRALALQQLNNESNARDATTEYTKQSTQLWEDFRQKQGRDAGPQAFQTFQKQADDLRNQISGGLGNPVAKNMFLNDSQSIMERLNLWGATHSGEQMDVYNKATHKAAMEQAANVAQLNPLDPTARQRAFDISDQSIEAMYRGSPPEDIAQKKAEAHSNIVMGSIINIASFNPVAAQKAFDQAKGQNLIRGEQLVKIQENIDKEMNQRESHRAVGDLFDGTLPALGQKAVSIERARDAIAMGIESGGNYDTVNKTSGALGKYQVMPGNLPGWLAQAGLPSMTAKEFLANHDAQDKVFDTIFGGYMQKYGSFNEAASMWFTGKTIEKAGNVSDGQTTNAGYIAAVNKRLATTATGAEVTAALRDHAAKIAPNNPNLPDIMASRGETRMAETQRDERHDTAMMWNTVYDKINNQAGRGPITLGALRQDQDFDQAYARLSPKDQAKIQGAITTAARQDNTVTDARTANANRMIGMAYSDDPHFAEQDLYGTDLTAEARSELISLQKRSIAGELLRDPVIDSAMKSWDIRSQLEDLGISKKDNPQDWNQFWGAFAEELKAARAQGKPVTEDQIDKITQGLLYQEAGKGFMGLGRGPMTFTTFKNIPNDQRLEIQKKWTQARGQNPTDDEVELVYAKAIYDATIAGKYAK